MLIGKIGKNDDLPKFKLQSQLMHSRLLEIYKWLNNHLSIRGWCLAWRSGSVRCILWALIFDPTLWGYLDYRHSSLYKSVFSVGSLFNFALNRNAPRKRCPEDKLGYLGHKSKDWDTCILAEIEAFWFFNVKLGLSGN